MGSVVVIVDFTDLCTCVCTTRTRVCYTPVGGIYERFNTCGDFLGMQSERRYPGCDFTVAGVTSMGAAIL